VFAQIEIMGACGKAENEAEDVTQQDPNMAQQSGQLGGGQSSQDDMQTAQNTIGQQGGYQDQDQGQDENQGW
jgi:general stress protein YciG